MQELQKRVEALSDAVAQATQQIGLTKLEAEAEDQAALMARPDFWTDNQKAQSLIKKHAELQTRIKPWQNLKQSIDDTHQLVMLHDAELQADLESAVEKLEQQFEKQKKDLQFAGSYDDHSVILQIFAGAGGTDAQDWAQMLERMYLRWVEQQGGKAQVVDRSTGEEAGIKSETIEISGIPYCYGKLKGEHGVHRLVRLSPFNSDNLRQTSFAKIDVLPVIDQPEDLEIDEKNLKVDVYRSGGHGGQSVNTTDSAVRVTHTPTGITVAIQNERSQLQNKETALTILRSKLAQLQLEQHKGKIEQLKGPNQSAEWGSQIRSYVLHPYKQVKDVRTKCESSDPDKVLNGDLEPFIDAYLEWSIGQA